MTKQDKKDFVFILNLLNEYRDSFSISTMYLKGENEDAKDAKKIHKILTRLKIDENI